MSRAVLSFQHFNGGKYPTNIILTVPLPDGLSPEKAFEKAVEQMRQEQFTKPE